MKVKQLIKELKKMPQNYKVGMAMHDNAEGEVAAWVFSVEDILEEYIEYGCDEVTTCDRCVVLRG